MAEAFINVTEGSGKKIHHFSRTIGADTQHDEVVLVGEQYLASYTVSTITPVSTATANSHVLELHAGASLRLRIRRIEVAQMVAATTAAMCQWAIYRVTTAGSGGTTITPQLLDPADSAAGAVGRTLPTAATEGALLWTGTTAMYQTISATPSNYPQPFLLFDADGLRRKPIHVAAGTSNGIALKNITAIAAATVTVVVWFDESNFI